MTGGKAVRDTIQLYRYFDFLTGDKRHRLIMAVQMRQIQPAVRDTVYRTVRCNVRKPDVQHRSRFIAAQFDAKFREAKNGQRLGQRFAIKDFCHAVIDTLIRRHFAGHTGPHPFTGHQTVILR
ncbi:hypothetical protein SRABI106_04643 [Rahnella aquatilis]|nr:hypothetical protein SRABI106_04643 [Rahnella aquatilis]